MMKDIKEYAKTCLQCQQRESMRQNNQKRTILLTDIFEKWEVNIVRPLPITRERNRYIVVAMVSRLPLTSLGYKVLTFSAFLAADSKLLVLLSRLSSASLGIQVLTFSNL